MDLDSFSIDQIIKVQGKSSRGKNRIIEHGNTWRVKNKFKKDSLPWVEEDSLLLESTKDGTTSRWMKVIKDNDFKFI